jgi:hypothetical protein
LIAFYPNARKKNGENYKKSALKGLRFGNTKAKISKTLYVCMAIKHIIVLFVETPRKFITAKLSIRKPGSSSVLII